MTTTEERALLTIPALPILQSLPVGIMVTDVTGVVTWVNDTLCAQLGATADDFIGKERSQIPAQKVPTTSQGVERFYIPPKAGQPERWLELITSTMTAPERAPFELGCVLDVTRYRQGKRLFGPSLELIDAAKLDSTTGLLTKKAIVQELISQLTRSRRYQNALSILMLRVSVNEEPGRTPAPPPETALKTVARVLKDKLRWADKAGHWENNDILLVLPETGLESGLKLAEKIRSYLSNVEPDGARIPETGVSIAMGVTGWRKDDDITQLIGRASRLLTDEKGHPVSGIRGS